MADDVSDTEALVRVELEHAGQEILEFLRVEALGLTLRIGVSLPEEVGPVSREELVVVVLLVGHSEGRVTRVQNEENNTESEKIDDLSLVGLSGENLRGHVAWSTDDGFVGARTVASLKRASEAEINNLYVVHFVEENVFGFKISMGETL